MLFEEGNKVVDLLRIQIEITAPIAWLDEARWCTRLLHIRHEVQEDEIHVLDFVSAAAHELFRDHPRRHVAAYAQTALVSFVGDDGHEFRLHRAVDFDLDVT
jgi:hypothetical protein